MKKTIIILFAFAGFAANAQIEDSAKRVVPVKGAVNFRDLGGYATADGHHVKWNRVYRSAAINKLTDADMQILAGRHIYDVVDFRGTEESKKAMDRLLPNTKYTLCPAGSENVGDWMKIAPQLSSADSLMTTFYANAQVFGDRYKPFFDELLQMPDTTALLFHCTAGKDRTGMGAALLLYALGVPKATIMQDYLATNTYRATENEQAAKAMVAYMHVTEKVANDMMAAKSIYLEATFNAIEKRYGSVNEFLTKVIGLDKAKIKNLRAKYLQE